mgnify:CR=1 FL=1
MGLISPKAKQTDPNHVVCCILNVSACLIRVLTIWYEILHLRLARRFDTCLMFWQDVIKASLQDLNWKFNYTPQSSLPTGAISQTKCFFQYQDSRVMFRNIRDSKPSCKCQDSIFCSSFDLQRTGRVRESWLWKGNWQIDPRASNEITSLFKHPFSFHTFYGADSYWAFNLFVVCWDWDPVLCPLPRSYYCDNHRELPDRPHESFFSWNVLTHQIFKTLSKTLHQLKFFLLRLFCFNICR